ncbi:MAG: amidohydrolase family protein [Planctomycetes bacterium]|nr:amidohydrolase family protein [Planctomycetota bacterium]
MGAFHRFVAVASLAIVLGTGCAAPNDIGTMIYVGDASVRDYQPRPALVTAVTPVDRARYPAVDVHCHWRPDTEPEAMLAAMDDRNVTRAVNLSGGWGADLDRMLDRYHGADPDRFVIFCNVDFSRIDEPDFGAAAAAELERGYRRGVGGLKIFKDLGLRIRDGSGRLVAVDDPRLDPIWAKCGELRIPVLIHSADPVAFFQPIDRHNERWMQLMRHPDWSFYDPSLPGREEVMAQRDRVMARHPKTNFIGAHVGGNAEDLAAASRVLEAHPNFFMDISGRVAELGRQPYAAREFLIEHQDRILFGTDRYPGRGDQPRYRLYFRFLETADEHFDYYDNSFPPAGDWRIYGVSLPDEVLKKIYHGNADRLLPVGPRTTE